VHDYRHGVRSRASRAAIHVRRYRRRARRAAPISRYSEPLPPTIALPLPATRCTSRFTRQAAQGGKCASRLLLRARPMELPLEVRKRLNMLAAIISLAILTAIVFGMV
jgi:hypothetical protein